MVTGIENLPPEVVHEIFSNLSPKDAFQFRLQARRYASIGAEYLETRLRFSTDEESLDRIAFYGKTPLTAKQVNKIVYEANLLSYRTKAEYFKHFQADHHAGELPYPSKLEPDASERSKRLYNRNLAQWEAARERDYCAYRHVYDNQQSTLHSQRFKDVLSMISKFPNIEHIQLSTEARCGHLLSERFLEKYPLTCTMPMDLTSDKSILQLTSLIIPKGCPLRGLKSLDVGALNPRAFNTTTFMASASRVFESLKRLRICFRLQKSDRANMDLGSVSDSYRFLQKSCLKDCLAAAKDLESLTLTFDDLGYYGPTIDVKHVFGTNVWPKLTHMDIDCMKGGGDIVQYFKRQPVLRDLSLSFMYLEWVAWKDIVAEMRKELSLETFTVRGLLEDEANYYSSVDLDEDAYVDDRIEMELAEVLEDYVTETPQPGDDDNFNPLADITWSDPDSLYARYGTIDQMEASESLDSSSDDDSDDDSMDID